MKVLGNKKAKIPERKRNGNKLRVKEREKKRKVVENTVISKRLRIKKDTVLPSVSSRQSYTYRDLLCERI